MNNNRPLPLYPTPVRAVCPVCGYPSYSATGVHPQCSMLKADRERMAKVKQVATATRTAAHAIELSPWQRVCPRCKAIAHIRKKVCECGYPFRKVLAAKRS